MSILPPVLVQYIDKIKGGCCKIHGLIQTENSILILGARVMENQV